VHCQKFSPNYERIFVEEES